MSSASSQPGVPRRKVLVVDDEPNVLHGIRRTLYKVRGQWGLLEAGSGEEAIEILDVESIDVLLCDLQLPGVDGSQVLSYASKVQPAAVRILFSGGDLDDLVLASTKHAHQFLLKPAQPHQLLERLESAAELQRSLEDERLMKVVSRCGDLPALPDLYLRVQREMESPQATVTSVGAILAADAAMSLRLLRAANSALARPRQEVTTVVQAVSLLGLDTVCALIIAADLFESPAPEVRTLESLWKHSMEVAACAQALAKHERLDQRHQNLAFLAGTLHDVGELVLHARLGQEYAELVQQADAAGTTLEEAQRQHLGATHAQVGAYLLSLWGMPVEVVRAVAASHGPSEHAGDELMPLLVHFADVFVTRAMPTAGPPHARLNTGWMTRRGATRRVADWRKVCADALA